MSEDEGGCNPFKALEVRRRTFKTSLACIGKHCKNIRTGVMRSNLLDLEWWQMCFGPNEDPMLPSWIR